MASCIQIENLSKSFGDKDLFRDISLGIADRERVALIAKNGTGKTTLLNIITNKEWADEGEVIKRGGLRVGYLSQTPDFEKNTTVLEACLQVENEAVHAIAAYEKAVINEADVEAMSVAMDRMDTLKAWDYEVRIKQILGKLNIINFSQMIGELSGGQLKRIALANVLISEPDLLILDEPTNHLDLAMVEWLEELLLRSATTLLMVTHDRYFLDKVCTRIVELDNGQLYNYTGNYSYYLEKRAERIANFNTETERANNLYRKELEWMRRQPQARATKAKGRINRFYDIETRAKQRQISEDVKLSIKADYLGSKIFEAQYVSKSYGDLKILDDFYYNFSRYEKMGIIGKNGSGKSTFIKLLLGEVKPDKGKFDIGETVKFGYYSQEGLLFNEGMKVIDAVQEIAEEVHIGNGKTLSASQFLQHFLFSPATQHNYIEKLSGGEKRRLYLCTILMKSPNFLILDEPTNDLDIATLSILEEYLQQFKGCVIVISHDRYFMDKVVDHILVFKGDANIKDFPGNYTHYREWQEDESRKEAQEKNALQQKKIEKERIDSTPQKKKKTYKERLEFEALEQEIEALEQDKNEIEKLFASNESIDNTDLQTLSQKFATINEEIEEKTLRWLELSELE